MYIYLIGLVVFLICIHFLNNRDSSGRMISKIPGPRSYFIVGHSLNLLLPTVAIFSKLRQYASQFNGIYAMYSLLFKSVHIYNPEDIEIITSGMTFHEKGWTYNFLSSWLRDGLLLSKGAKWKQRRKILTSAFHFNVLLKYFATIKTNDKILIETLKKSEGKSVDIVDVISEYTLNTICETAMDTKLSDNTITAGNLYKNAVYALGELFMYRIIRPWLHSDFMFNLSSQGKRHENNIKIVHSFTRTVIEKRKKNITKEKTTNDVNKEHVSFNTKKKNAMLDLLISAQKDGLIDDIGIQEEVDTFMFEGHDTTAAGITFCLLLLANYPKVQETALDELKVIFGNDTRDASTDDLTAMRYLDLCIKETLRLYPPVPLIIREIKQPVILSNYTVPANTLCSIHIYDLHRSERLYQNPNNFDPERFLPERAIGRHPYAYIPFSAGPRNCIGQKFAMMEMKSVISSILRYFKLVPVTKEADLCFMADIILRNSKPVYVKFMERKCQI